MSKETGTGQKKTDILQGTLDLMVLQTLDALGPLHGYGIARRIEQVSESILQLNEGTVYTALLRLQQQGAISSKWGASDNNRRARFYSITRSGRNQLARETEEWQRIAGVTSSPPVAHDSNLMTRSTFTSTYWLNASKRAE